MKYTSRDHTFVVCAYKESEYLEECILSLEKQRKQGKIIISTSTPNQYIDRIAKRHNLTVFINDGETGIAEDWNFAYSRADTRLVTLAHQDDEYDAQYLEQILDAANHASKPLICFSDYYELRNGKRVYSKDSRLLKIKRMALMPLRLHFAQSSVWVRRRILSVCNPICCPAVTYIKDNLPSVLFEHHFASNVDWHAWEALSRLRGQFCYVKNPLMGHRIHSESTTTQVIGEDSGRTQEDLEMLMKFWPRPIATIINKLYSKGQKSNDL